MKKVFCLLMVVLLGEAASAQTSKQKSLKEIICRGNIVTTTYQEDAEAGCYLGNGRFGAVFSGLGLMLSPEQQKNRKTGQSQFSHLNHWGRFRFVSSIEKKETTADYLLPLLKLHWEEEPKTVSSYRQEQNMYDGVLETAYTLDNGVKVRVQNWFDQINKNLVGIRLELSEGTLSVKATALTDFLAYSFVFRKPVRQSISAERVGDNYLLTIACEETLNRCRSQIYFYSTAPVELCEDGLRFLVSKGKNEIFVSYGEPVRQKDRVSSLQRTKKHWHETWRKSGWMDFPEENAQKMWVRSMAYLLSSYDDFEAGIIQPTNGLTGNVFPFHFVQDLGYISPALMMTGHNGIVMCWMEKFAGEIEAMKKYAKHLWPQSEGIYPPWELPFGSIEGYHEPNVPVAYCYEPHNPGYLCRMAKEAADFAGDPAWAKRYAYPLIREVCRFYRSACKKGTDGLWHMEWYPSIGQDEAGGRNKKNYLCSLYSAQYSFQTAVELGLDEDGSLVAILKDGLAFESLMSDRGTYHTAHDADDFGKQKHPVQLDGLAYFPIKKQPLLPERKAYELRQEITERAKEPFFAGWTLGEFLLAGSNIKDVKGWREDWAKMRPSNYTDSRWIQIYETSGNAGASFYVTTHGMILQSLIRNYVNDYWGGLDIASCPVFEGDVSFGNIGTRLGVTVSGTVAKGKVCLSLTAQRDCTFGVNGVSVTMKRGETKKMNW